MRSLADFDLQPHTRGRGRAAEEAACAHLEEEGYRVVERNVTTGAGEIDIVAIDADTLCFVEVKARARSSCGDVLRQVDAKKRRRLVRAAALYLAQRNEPERAVRFDVLGLERRGGRFRYLLVRDAFEAEDSFLV